MKKDQFLSGRVYLLIAVMGLWGTVIGTRLYFLQAYKGSDYRARAQGQQQQTLDVMPPRGVIYDRNGSELAASIKVKSVFAVPKEVQDKEATARTLASLTGQDFADLTSKLSEEHSFVWIKRKVSGSEASAIERAKLAGIHFQDESQRFYPNQDMAAQVLGYVGVDGQGLGGLEGRYNDSIRGESGRIIYIHDATGKSFNQIEQPAVPGASLVTTIDRKIQHFVEQELRAAEERTHAKGIYIVVMDPHSGEILAMASYPNFNANDHRITDIESLRNGAISNTYEPGSTFKILTVGAALEEGLTTPDDRIDCLMGSIVIAGQRIHDHKAFGVLTVSEILQKSSDVGAITLGQRLEPARMAKYINLYGFGKQTGIDLPGEERGQVHPLSQWRKTSIGYISMGQEIAVTPLQIVSLVSMIANGGTLYKPYVVKEVRDPALGVISHTDPSGQRVMSLKSAEEMQGMLEKVVTDGTAKPAKLEGYRAAGKTGTAQKANPAGGYYANKLIASFAGFAPASNPVISMVVVVDEPVGSHMGGEVAAPIFKSIADQVLHYKAIAPDVIDYAPRYTAAPAKRENATQPVEDIKVVAANFNAATALVHPFEPGEIMVPDFRGKSLKEINAECWKLGLTTTSEGTGRSSQQYPPAGTMVRLNTVVALRFTTK